MKKPSSRILAVLLGLVITAGIIAAKAPAEGKQYDYVMVEKLGHSIYVRFPIR